MLQLSLSIGLVVLYLCIVYNVINFDICDIVVKPSDFANHYHIQILAMALLCIAVVKLFTHLCLKLSSIVWYQLGHPSLDRHNEC